MPKKCDLAKANGNGPNLGAIRVDMNEANRETAFRNTGAVEQDRPEQKTNVAPLEAQLDHTYQDPLNKASDSGMANRGQTPEFTGETQARNELEQDTNANVDEDSEEPVDQDPGERQKENQDEKKDDDLAA